MNVQNTFRRRSGSLLNVLYMFNLRPLFEDGSPVDTGRKLNVHKTTRRRPGCLLNVLCTFSLRPVSTGILAVAVSSRYINILALTVSSRWMEVS